MKNIDFSGVFDKNTNDKPQEECGVFGVYLSDKPRDVASMIHYGLYALQHRGQESCGIAVNDDGVIEYKKNIGLVSSNFSKETLKELPHGKIGIGHCRYSKADPSMRNVQPLVVRHAKGNLSISNNGCLINAKKLREQYESKGAIFHSTTDAEVIGYVITEGRLKKRTLQEAVSYAMKHLEGAYSLVIMSAKKLIIARDPKGFRPLCYGVLPDNAGYVAASESCAMDTIGAKFIRDVAPGEIITFDDNGITSDKTHCKKNEFSSCVFEFVYFARPDSVIDGISVHEARVQAGKFLYEEHPVEADLVIGVPDSGIQAAAGYSYASGIPFSPALIKNRYISRTFILPTQNMRENAVKIKLNPVSTVIKGKRVVLIDDSIVRGTTTKNLVKLLRDAGASEVHLRISSPPFKHPCYFGTDIDSRSKLIAHNFSLEEIRRQIDADSLGYLSIENIKKIGGEEKCCNFCVGCFTGEYPISVPEECPEEIAKSKFEHKLGDKIVTN